MISACRLPKKNMIGPQPCSKEDWLQIPLAGKHSVKASMSPKNLLCSGERQEWAVILCGGQSLANS